MRHLARVLRPRRTLTHVPAARMRGRLGAGIASVLAARGMVVDAIDAPCREHAGR